MMSPRPFNALLALLLPLLFAMCTTDKPASSTTSESMDTIVDASAPDSLPAQDSVIPEPEEITPKDVAIYSLGQVGFAAKPVICFVTISEYFQWDLPEDLQFIPPDFVGEVDYPSDTTFNLEGSYRAAVLSQIGISESDSIFIFSFQQNRVESYLVSSTPIVAFLNVYHHNEQVARQQDFMLGFRPEGAFIDSIVKNHHQTLVAVGDYNPFQSGEAVSLVWTTSDKASFPDSVELHETLRDLTVYKHYQFSSQGMEYRARSLMQDERIRCVQFIVLQDSQMVFEQTFCEGEGGGPTLSTEANTYYGNWTGSIFKHRPPIMFGLNYQSFGCPNIEFIGEEQNPIYISCDNRH